MREHYPGISKIAYPNEEPLDGFGRVRVSYPFRIFDAQFNYGLQPRIFEQLNNGEGSVVHVPFSSAARLSTGGGLAGNRSIFQSKLYHRYNPDKSQQIVWTCVLGDKKNNVSKIIGYIDDEDGLAFIQDQNSLGILRRTSTSGLPIDNITPQSEWNIDGLNKSLNSKNPSGITLDEANDNIFIVDFQWLGAGRIRYGFDFGGHITYVHQEEFANTRTTPFMRTANLPFRVEILNTGEVDGETTLDFICLAINSEGGAEPRGLPGLINNALATGGVAPFRAVTSGNQPIPIISIRPNSIFKGLINRSQVRPIKCEATSKDASVYYSVILNGILIGSSFVNVDTDSNVEVDVSATGISGGIIIDGGYVGGVIGAQGLDVDESNLEDIILSNNIVGDFTDILSIVVGLAGSINSDCAGEFKWGELR